MPGIRPKTKYQERNCKNCSAVFYTYPSQNKQFCSYSCSNTFVAKRDNHTLPHPSGQEHHNWKGGISTDDRKERMRFRHLLQEQIFIRDNYTCQVCQEVGGKLQVDHIKKWSDYPELRFELDNCRTLCMACHYYVTFKRKMPKGIVWGHNLSRRIAS